MNFTIKLFRVAGIQVSLHWSWLLVAAWQITSRGGFYRSQAWMVAEYLALFLIVLIHEFGHALASRQVGGESRDILLWPFGGIAFVKVPPRPGAELWSIAAGPLVNVVLWPVLAGLFYHFLPRGYGSLLWNFDIFVVVSRGLSDPVKFFGMVFFINQLLLLFNLLPIYPLDGGQILRSGLWFWLGRARSLHVASIIGFIGVGLGAAYVLFGFLRGHGSVFEALMVVFVAQQCLAGFRQAKALRALERLPRHRDFVCPACRQAPPGGPLWLCQSCGQRFDPFSTRAVCPHCTTPQAATMCPHCHAAHPLERWSPARSEARG